MRNTAPAVLWWKDAAPVNHDHLPLPTQVDVVIVGGGYSGLSAALTLARGGASVAVCDASPFGYGASARNSGGVSFGLEIDTLRHYRKWLKLKGVDLSELALEAAQAVTDLATFVAAEGVDCDFQMAGRLIAATSPAKYRTLESRADSLNRWFGADAHLVEREQQASEIGSSRFHGALIIKKSGQLHPAKLLHGLVKLCLQADVTLHSGASVTRIERNGNALNVLTDRGAIRCEHVLLATNAHVSPLGDVGLHTRVVPVASNIIVTEELSPALLQQLLPRGRTGSDGRKVLAYFRITPDGKRFLYGSRAAPGEISTEQASAILLARMKATFPTLSTARIEYMWGCHVSFTLDRIPHIGESNGIHFIAGCHGNGVAMMNHLGRQVALRILQGTRSAFANNDFPRIPLYRGNPWFLPAIHRTYQFFDWKSER